MRYEVAVVGGGIMGLATAYALLRRGVRRIVVLERFKIGHDRAASTDNTKAIRYEYADNVLYSRMVGRAIESWRDLEAKTHSNLYMEAGVVCWGRGDAPHTRQSYITLRELGLPIREIAPSELASYYPQFDAADMSYVTINPEGGFLRATACGMAYAALIEDMGGEIREDCPVMEMAAGDGGIGLRVASGERIQAERVALCMGAWSSKMLPYFGLPVPVTANKQQVMYLDGLGAEYQPGTFPVFLNLDHDFYGFPLDEQGLLKVSLHRPGIVINPDQPEKPDSAFDDEVRELVRRYIPGAGEAQAKMTRVCMYAMTPDEDFVLDRHPQYRNATVAAGFSGHGFKFAPVIGDLMFALLMDEEPEFAMEKFALSRFG